MAFYLDIRWGFLAITYSQWPNNNKGKEIATSDYSYATRRGKNDDNSHAKRQRGREEGGCSGMTIYVMDQVLGMMNACCFWHHFSFVLLLLCSAPHRLSLGPFPSFHYLFPSTHTLYNHMYHLMTRSSFIRFYPFLILGPVS